MSLGLLSQPEPCWHLVPTSPVIFPQPPTALTHFCRLQHGVGLWLNCGGRGGNQTAIWNLNETKFISLCCHFIFHRLDGESTGDPRGPFWFAHKVEKQEGGGKWLRDRRPCPFHQLVAHTQTKLGEDKSFPWRPTKRARFRRLMKDLFPS